MMRIKEIKTSALRGNLQKQKDASNHSNSNRALLPNPGQERGDEIGVAKEEKKAFIIEIGIHNKWVQCRN